MENRKLIVIAALIVAGCVSLSAGIAYYERAKPPVVSQDMSHKLILLEQDWQDNKAQLNAAMQPYVQLNAQIEAAMAPYKDQQTAALKVLAPYQQKQADLVQQFNALTKDNPCVKYKGKKKYQLVVPPKGDAYCQEVQPPK